MLDPPGLKRRHSNLLLLLPRLRCLRPTKKYSEIDLNFERAGVLFNIGAVKSHIAASADRAQAEGVKLACREFQVG